MNVVTAIIIVIVNIIFGLKILPLDENLNIIKLLILISVIERFLDGFIGLGEILNQTSIYFLNIIGFMYLGYILYFIKYHLTDLYKAAKKVI